MSLAEETSDLLGSASWCFLVRKNHGADGGSDVCGQSERQSEGKRLGHTCHTAFEHRQH